MSITRNRDDHNNLEATSRPTSISSDNEESESNSNTKKVSMKGQKSILLSDEDSEDEGRASSDSEEDGIAFLNRFRQKQANSGFINEVIDKANPFSDSIIDPSRLVPQPHASSIFSGSLSELSSTQQNIEANTSDQDVNHPSSSSHHHLRPDDISLFLSSNDSALNRAERSALQEEGLYRTEAEKRAEQDHKRAERRSAMERLAAKSRKVDDNHSERESSVPTEDHITSTSDKDASIERISKKQRKKSKKVGDKVRTRTLNLGPELDVGGILSSEDEDVRPSTSVAEKQVRPLSKKDLDEMNRVQARIEREKRISSTRVRQAPRERKRFGIHDLLAKIGNSEADRKQALPLTKLERTIPSRQSCTSPSSDPIEAYSDNDEINVDQKTVPVQPPSRPFYAQIKDRKTTGLVDDDDDIDLFESENLIEKALRQSEKRDRWRQWQERKKAVLKDTIASGKGTENVDEDDIELYRDVDKAITVTANTSHQNDMHSRTPDSRLGHSEGPRMLVGVGIDPLDENESAMAISTQQIQRFGRLIGQKDQQKSSKDTIASAINTEKLSNKPKLHERTKDQFKGTKTVDLQAYIMHKMERQNIESRKGKGLKQKVADDNTKISESEKQDIATLIENLQKNVQDTDHQNGEKNGDDDDEDDTEYTPEGDDQEQEMEHDYGSGYESGGFDSSVEDTNVISERINTDDAEGSLASDSEEEDITLKPRETQKSRKHQHNRVVLDEDDNDESLSLSGQKESLHALSPAIEIMDGEKVVQEGTNKQMTSTLINASQKDRDISAVFGQFFEDTQSDAPLQSDSFKVLSMNGQDGAGFTQFFEQGTPMKSSSRNDLMPPPTMSAKGFNLNQASDQDGFAALRKAQASQAKLIDDDPFDLPALDDILLPEQQDANLELELEAMRAEEEERILRLKSTNRSENGVTYINKEGFFTQTRPQSYSFQLSQMHSQVENSIEGYQETTKTSLMESGNEIDNDEEEDVILNSRNKRRYRRAVSAHDEEGQMQRDSFDVRPVGRKEIEQEPMHGKQTAFDILREGSRTIKRKTDDKARKIFIQGEAEESDGDSEDGDEKNAKKGKNKGRHGGLEGVFSDQEDQNSGEEEDDDEEEDGQDLEDLIDEQKDENEAEKDILARERYLKDVDEDEKAALALHERAIRGAFRNKRRSRNHQNGNLEGFLEDDYEDDWLQKLAKNPYGNIAKKRRLEGKDGMDLLAGKEDSQAFVREYHDSHRDSQPLDAYSFLMHEDEDEEDEDADEVESQQNSFISRKDIQDAIAQKRKAKRMEARRLRSLDDEVEAEEWRKKQEEEEIRERELRRNIERALYNASDDEDDVQDQLRNTHSIARFNLDRQNEATEQDEDKEDASLASVLPGVATRSHISDREKARLAKLAKDFENEPDWQSAKEAIQRVRGRPTAAKNESLASRTLGDSQSNGKQTNSTSSSSNIRTRLQGVMSRENLFS
ncbi:hypothetical protein L7F22_039088 [Adiantum nelumboides]|nr:hypothetical protein [Adiantum nelumboides]